jgi:hypothetical protein
VNTPLEGLTPVELQRTVRLLKVPEEVIRKPYPGAGAVLQCPAELEVPSKGKESVADEAARPAQIE